MRFVGVDIASALHVAAVVDEDGKALVKSLPFAEDAEGYSKLLGMLGASENVLVAMEATGHYWRNLFAYLTARGYAVAVLNPLRTHRFAGEDLARTKTDALDALCLARFAQQKRPTAARLPDKALEGLREWVRLRDRFMQDFTDKVRQLHRLVDLGFPEFTRHIKTLDSDLATSILAKYPTAKAFQQLKVRQLASLRYDGRHFVGKELATTLIEAARTSVGAHHGEPYRLQVRFACEDMATLRERMRQLDGDIEAHLEGYELGRLMVQFDGLGPLTVARVLAEVGNPAAFKSPKALVAYVGLCPGLALSGKRQTTQARLTPLGNARLRRALWMPTLNAVRFNLWLKAHYERLLAVGKKPKVALVACMRKLMHALYAIAKSGKPFTFAPPPAPPSQQADQASTTA